MPYVWYVHLIHRIVVVIGRVNGFKKQTEILRQKHAEFLEKYKISGDRDDK